MMKATYSISDIGNMSGGYKSGMSHPISWLFAFPASHLSFQVIFIHPYDFPVSPFH